jgi:hypothetical protein
LIRAATDATKNLPPGWRVEAYSGQRNQGPHSHGAAIDFRIINDKGQEIPNYKTPGTFSIYEKFAQDTHLALQKIDPALAAQHRWGGYFSGSIAPDNAGGQYGAMDLMHQDFAGGDNRMAAGQWKTGLHPEWAQRWGVTDSSSGIADRARSNTASYQQAPNAPPSEAQKPWGAQAEPLPDYSNYHPINKVKVDNRSDQDVSHAKTSSDSDQGSSEPATEDNMPTDL